MRSSPPRPLLHFYGYYLRFPLLTGATVLLLAGSSAGMPLIYNGIGLAMEDLVRGDAISVGPDGAVDLGGAWFWVALLLGLVLARGTTMFLGAWSSMVLGQRLLHSIRYRLLDRVQELDLDFHQRHGAGELITRTTRDADKVRDAVIIGSRMICEMSAVLLGIVGLLFYYHWSLGMLSLGTLLLSVTWMWHSVSRLEVLERDASRSYDRLTQQLAEDVAGARVIKTFQLQEPTIDAFTGRVDTFAAKAFRARFFEAVRLGLPQVVMALGHCAVFVYGIFLVDRGILQPGHYVAACMMLVGAVFRLEAIRRGLGMVAAARAAARRLHQLLTARPSIHGGSAPVPDGPLGVRLNGVFYRAGGHEILRGVDLEIRPGERVALVGPTGSGKTSLVNLLPRLKLPASGRIELVDAAGRALPVADADLDDLRTRVQVVHQDVFLFSAGAADNLRVARGDATDAEIWKALATAEAADFIAASAGGLDTPVGEKGVNLSGGQQQRLCLARALLARPGLLVLDDSTNALDAVTEAAIHRRLPAATAGATVLLVTSRLSTVFLADRVILLDAGRVVAAGTHAELRRESSLYRQSIGLETPREGSHAG